MFIHKRISRLILLGAACALITACASSGRSSRSVQATPTVARAAATPTQIAQTSYSAAVVSSGRPTFPRANGTTVTVEELQIRQHSDQNELARRYFMVVLLDITGTSDSGCINTRDVRLFASGEPIAPKKPDMIHVQGVMTPHREYVSELAGHCVDRGESEKSFVVFDVSATSTNFAFAIDDKQHPFQLSVREPAAIRDYERFTFEDDAQRVALVPRPTSPPESMGANTNIPQPTSIPTLTPNASATTERATFTPPPPRTTRTSVPTYTRTPASVAQADGTTYYVTANANIRSCAATTCAALGRLAAGATFIALERVEGERVTGSNPTWYRFNYNGNDGFIYSGLTSTSPVSAAAPVAPPPARPGTSGSGGSGGGSGGNISVAPPAPTSAPAAVSWDCNGDRYNCNSFNSCADMWSYWNACPGDPSRLDGNNDGRPCESRC